MAFRAEDHTLQAPIPTLVSEDFLKVHVPSWKLLLFVR